MIGWIHGGDGAHSEKLVAVIEKVKTIKSKKNEE